MDESLRFHILGCERHLLQLRVVVKLARFGKLPFELSPVFWFCSNCIVYAVLLFKILAVREDKCRMVEMWLCCSYLNLDQ